MLGRTGQHWDVSAGKTRYREEVWERVSTPRAFLFVSELGRQDVTGHGAWPCSPCPLLSALMDAGQHPPKSRTTAPGAAASRRKGWRRKKKDGGGGYFQI